MNTTTTLTTIGNGVTLKAISEWIGGTRMDTEILLNDVQLCSVCGADYEEFMDQLNNLINTYRI